MPQSTNKLNLAKRLKNDEFYTIRSFIEKELKYYLSFNHFKNKVVLLNCNDSKQSQFFKYFKENFNTFKLKKLIAISYGENATALILEKNTEKEIPLKGNGDFRSDESINFLKESDIIVTNPPFSLFRAFMKQLIDYNKKFLIIGNKNALKYKETFPLIKDNKIWAGVTLAREFNTPNEERKEVSAIWFTNLENEKRDFELSLTATYKGNEELYPKYDNYDAINIDKLAQIPKEYNKIMGVPITFLLYYNRKQFEIVGGTHIAKLNGKRKYTRIFIKKNHHVLS